MPETLEKLRPDRDLQCYFERPSAIAALSRTSQSGFTLSGAWRQQFDWAVIEWNRDNLFEHPLLRNLPDGDLSGLRLSYEETRTNCIPVDSDLPHTVDWPSLRIWADPGSGETVYKVPLFPHHATAVEGSYTPASATFELGGTASAGDYVELAWQSEHFNFSFPDASVPLTLAVQDLADQINNHSSILSAAPSGTQITLTHRTPGANGNRLGVYATVYSPSGAPTETWQPSAQTLSGGTSPARWRYDFDFSNLRDETNTPVPAGAIRKMRWTYAAAQQPGAFQRSEFEVVVSNWTVTGTGRGYTFAGPQSRRVEDDRGEIAYTGHWTTWRGNYSGGSIRYTTTAGDSVSFSYHAPQAHQLYLGTLKSDNCSSISILVDGNPLPPVDLLLPGEVVLTRLFLGDLAAGQHSVTVSHAGPEPARFFFDFFEIAVPVSTLPDIPADPALTLATDWDTDHSIALAPERTAWLIHKLGFRGRANHYVGALWFYELVRQGHQYASASVQFTGTPEFSAITEISITIGPETATIQHVNLIGDTAESIAKAFELIINDGYTAIWAQSSGAVLTIYSRAMGAAGNQIGISAAPQSGPFQAIPSGPAFSGGADGDPDFSAAYPLKGWRTDLTASPRINRAARDWSRSFFQALHGYGIEVAAAFSMELQHGDFTSAAGIAQRYPNGDPVLLNTPALQTNFSPASVAFWRQAYLDLAALMAEAGQTPYLQFGEVQWWYFPLAGSGMTFYDGYTTSTFQSVYGRPMHIFTTAQEDPSLFPEEAQFLPGLIGAFTSAVMDFVRQTYPGALFEVLYPPDVNDFPLTRVINFPAAHWTPSSLAALKTENFTFTGNRDLNKARASVLLPLELGFTRSQSSHLVGIGDYTTPWLKEAGIARSQGAGSIVLFALDQFCLIGYNAPLDRSRRRSGFMGSAMG